MKVTVQNGAAHGLTRRNVEALVPLFPAAWSLRVKQIVLYQGSTPDVRASFHPKEQVLGLHWPVPAASASKAEGVRELLLALSVVAARGELPDRLSPALRERHQAELKELLQQCITKVAPHAI